MKHKMILVILSLTLLITPSLSAFESSATSGKDILISEVYPKEEAFSLMNAGSSEIDLKGYVVTDGEGTLEIIKSIKLASKQQVTFSKENTNNYFDSDAWVIPYSSDCLSKKGNLILADNGDELSLLSNSNTVDAVCWGNSNGVEGWVGEPAKISSGMHLVRKNAADTDSADDWSLTRRGWTNSEPYEFTFDATVAPFSFPEDKGTPILSTLMEAENSIDLSIYLVTSRDVISILCQKAQSGVDVRILVEGSPLGVDISSELSLLKAVEESGGEVRLINYTGAENTRYSYLHNKYALIDGHTALITSENWTAGNIGECGNRGWGAVIRSEGYVNYMSTVFENDFSTGIGDVAPLSTVYPNLKAKSSLDPVNIKEITLTYYESEVTPTVSPDNSFDTLKQFIYSSEERLFVEQMDLGGSLSGTTGETPISWMSDTSSNGVDTRFILDCSQSDAETHKTYLNLIEGTTSIKAVGFSDGNSFELIHNKGIISDSSVWVGSVNWTDTSFTRNRETAVIINSPDVSEHFAKLFESDFGTNIYTVIDGGLNLQATVIDTENGKLIKLTVDGPTGYKYRWTLGDLGTRETQSPYVLFDAPDEGEYLATVIIDGFDIAETVSVKIGSEQKTELDPILASALALAIIMPCIGAIVYAVRLKNNSKKRRRVQKCRYR